MCDCGIVSLQYVIVVLLVCSVRLWCCKSVVCDCGIAVCDCGVVSLQYVIVVL